MAKPFETITPMEKLTEAELEVYNMLVPRHKASAIKLDGFNYKDVEDNKAEIAVAEKAFLEQGKREPWKLEQEKRAELFEAILAEQIELSDWLGNEARTIVPSRYDDIKNGVDLIIEFEREAGFFKHLGLSVDATTHIPSIAKKIDRVRKDIAGGHLTTVKYFISEQRGYRGELGNVPRVVVGADPRSIRELAGIWLNLSELKKNKIELEKELGIENQQVSEVRARIRKLQPQLAEHRIQFQILEEIKMQLEYFIGLATEERKDEIAQKYQSALETIKDILAAKEFELSGEERQKIEKDPAYQAIVREVS